MLAMLVKGPAGWFPCTAAVRAVVKQLDALSRQCSYDYAMGESGPYALTDSIMCRSMVANRMADAVWGGGGWLRWTGA